MSHQAHRQHSANDDDLTKNTTHGKSKGAYGPVSAMSASANARNATENTRRPTTSGAKSRAPSSRVAPKERPFSSGEVIPEDSASNAPPRRSVSDVQRINGESRKANERQTARVHLGLRENLQVRTRSPVKLHSEDGPNERHSREMFPVQPRSRVADELAPAPKKGKKNIRELGESVQKHSESGLIRDPSSIMEASSLPHCPHNNSPGRPYLHTSYRILDSRIS